MVWAERVRRSVQMGGGQGACKTSELPHREKGGMEKGTEWKCFSSLRLIVPISTSFQPRCSTGRLRGTLCYSLGF